MHLRTLLLYLLTFIKIQIHFTLLTLHFYINELLCDITQFIIYSAVADHNYQTFIGTSINRNSALESALIVTSPTFQIP